MKKKLEKIGNIEISKPSAPIFNSITENMNIIIDKINEIIDVLNSSKEEKK